MPIYDRPTKTLMHEFAEQELKPGQIFDKSVAVDWFRRHYPNIKSNTVQMHVEGMAVNSTSRKHHPSIRPTSGHDLFFKVGPSKYRLWNKDSDPVPFYPGASQAPIEAAEYDPDDVSQDAQEESSQEFAFERDLQNFLVKNLGALEPGLKIYQEEGITGVEFPAGGRFIDILAVDQNDAFVVIELKVSRGYDRVIG